LGDAVIEVYTLLLAKRILNHLELEHKPEDLHNFKAILLSCFGLTLFGISLEIVETFQPNNSTLLSELSYLSDQLKLNESMKIIF
jgi:hypothetical protein